MQDIIELSDDLIIGKGRDRVCYKHPAVFNLCIKISITTDKQSIREMRYFKFLESKQADLSKISTFLGKVKTNKGLGYSFDLIRDYDGKVSKTLLQSLESNECSMQKIRPLISELKQYLITNKICVRDISPSNISCQKTKDDINLFIIDGVSNSNINPLTIRLQGLINKAIEKAWKGLNKKLERFETSN
jgi:hypothetical protein